MIKTTNQADIIVSLSCAVALCAGYPIEAIAVGLIYAILTKR